MQFFARARIGVQLSIGYSKIPKRIERTIQSCFPIVVTQLGVLVFIGLVNPRSAFRFVKNHFRRAIAVSAQLCNPR